MNDELDRRTKTPDLDPCPECRGVQLRLARMYGRGLRRGVLPATRDDESWAELKKDHDDDCYWLATRGYRRFPLELELGYAART